MTYFAQINDEGVVIAVVAANNASELKGQWIETELEGGKRKNYAGIGFIYDKKLDVFVPPKPAGNSAFDEKKAIWISLDPPEPVPVSPMAELKNRIAVLELRFDAIERQVSKG